jgi:hypothetical protein
MGGMRCLRGPETRVSCCKHAVRQYYMPTMDGMDIHSNGCWVCGGPSCFETLRADSALVLACFPHQREWSFGRFSDSLCQLLWPTVSIFLARTCKNRDMGS